MSIKPWMTSADLIESVKRKIAVPINQRTFTDEDVLAFANEEMMISQVPDILQYHEEFFVTYVDVPILANQKRYPIPERALGQKLRDVWYVDTNNNLYEMVRINPNDQSYWQRETSANNVMQKYFLEGNEIVLAPQTITSPTGSLRFTYYLRPNQLVLNEKAAISSAFFKNITVTNGTIVDGDTITIGSVVFTAVSGSPAALEFQIGANSVATASNLVTSILTDATYSASNGSPSTNIVKISYSTLSTDIEASNTIGFSVSSQTAIQFTADLPDAIVDGVKIDFLQTKPGHKTLKMSQLLPIGSVSSDSITFNSGVIPQEFIIGDYICEEYECIIPQIPPDLHNGLAERVCGRILAAQGDAMGLQMIGAKLGDIQKSEGALMDNRIDGSTQKITQRKGLLSYLRMGIRRRI